MCYVVVVLLLLVAATAAAAAAAATCWGARSRHHRYHPGDIELVTKATEAILDFLLSCFYKLG